MLAHNKIITEGRTLTESDLVFFSYFTGDWFYLHTDKEAAKKTIFRERIFHGYLVLSVSLGLMVRSGMLDKERFVALKSIHEVEFLKPVKIGDTVHVEFIFNTTENEKYNSVVINGETINQDGITVIKFKLSYLEKKIKKELNKNG
ncbi:MAG: dehydratase [Candidatus Thermoplasmatota archaeon]|jgi:acyl dehydratase|nr:dehydratase [Candidatus Thermoplasmatota archaeon]MCL5963126.1 dehydratase [Candidatus Thermoplasmatota archaeon]